MESEYIILIVIAVVVIGAIFALRRSAAKPDIPKAQNDPTPRPPMRGTEERLELDAPVEIHDGMSLAEVKRAKAARIKGSKERRQTAVEATEESKKEHVEVEPEPQEPEATAEAAPAEANDTAEPPSESVEEKPADMDDISSGWEEMLNEPEVEAKATPPAEVSPADAPSEEPAVAESPEPESAEPEDAEVSDDLEDAPEVAMREVSTGPRLDTSSEVATTTLADGLSKTRKGFIHKLGTFFSGATLDEDLVEEVEEVLYTADIGTAAASEIMNAISEQLSSEEKGNPEQVWEFVQNYVQSLLTKRESKIEIDSADPFVMLVVGVNGVGKTTTIGKMASKYKKQGKSVMLVAGDTFRAAAVEQLQVWGERTGIPVHTGSEKADPASVIYSGIERGKEEGANVIICDTAGRLHTKQPLLDELGKIGRSAQKVIEGSPHEVVLVLDANTGQNAIQQAKIFNEAVDITGIVLTKLDGTAKGGVILGICEELDAPIRFIGIGEGVADLREFNAAEFTEALFL